VNLVVEQKRMKPAGSCTLEDDGSFPERACSSLSIRARSAKQSELRKDSNAPMKSASELFIEAGDPWGTDVLALQEQNRCASTWTPNDHREQQQT
jgi:hypothetical protein